MLGLTVTSIGGQSFGARSFRTAQAALTCKPVQPMWGLKPPALALLMLLVCLFAGVVQPVGANRLDREKS